MFIIIVMLWQTDSSKPLTFSHLETMEKQMSPCFINDRVLKADI